MKLFSSLNHPGVWITTIMAASILMITMGTRQSMGLYVGPLNTDTGLGIVSISLAMAIGQFVWGAIQPIAGAFADKFGPRPVLLSGLLILVLGSALTPFVSSQLGLILTLGLLTAIGSGACSFSVLLGAVAQRMPATSRGTASGIINAGSSFGQFVFARTGLWHLRLRVHHLGGHVSHAVRLGDGGHGFLGHLGCRQGPG